MKTEVVAYRIKSIETISEIRKALGPSNKQWTNLTLSKFAKGSFVYDRIKEDKLLTKYYRPKVSKYETIELSNARTLEEELSYLTNPESTIHNVKCEIKFVDSSGQVVPNSRELYVALRELKSYHDKINKILNYEI